MSSTISFSSLQKNRIHIAAIVASFAWTTGKQKESTFLRHDGREWEKCLQFERSTNATRRSIGYNRTHTSRLKVCNCVQWSWANQDMSRDHSKVVRTHFYMQHFAAPSTRRQNAKQPTYDLPTKTLDALKSEERTRAGARRRRRGWWWWKAVGAKTELSADRLSMFQAHANKLCITMPLNHPTGKKWKKEVNAEEAANHETKAECKA